MKDRVSTKILNNGATRYGVYDETGKLLRYEYIKLEDEPSTEGDFFNKANMLPDSITAMLGLKMENPQVKDALNVLANVGNLHVWERVQSLSEPTYLINSGDISLELYGDWYYSDSLTVASDLSLSLDSPSTINFSSSNLPSGINTIAGKFIKKSGKTDVYFCPVDYNYSSSIVGDYGYVSGITNAKIVIGQPAGTTTDYLTSTDRDAYAEGTVDSTTITYLGKIGRPGVVLSSYRGTGAYGQGSPTTLHFEKLPNVIFISGHGEETTVLTSMQTCNIVVGTASFDEYATTHSVLCNVLVDGNTVKLWSTKGAYAQMNRACEYFVAAFYL